MVQVSVIIPTWNASKTLEKTLGSLGLNENGLDVIVVDGGSSDATCEIASANGARLLLSPKGRGRQLARGAEQVAGDWFLFLHADTILEDGWFAAVNRAINAHKSDTGAARAYHFRFALNDASKRARRLERAVNWRSRWLKLPYGDQGLLISRVHYAALGGYPDWPLFEDVHLVRAIVRHGGRKALQALETCAITDALKFQRDGYGRRSRRNIILLARYFLGANPEKLAKRYE